MRKIQLSKTTSNWDSILYFKLRGALLLLLSKIGPELGPEFRESTQLAQSGLVLWTPEARCHLETDGAHEHVPLKRYALDAYLSRR